MKMLQKWIQEQGLAIVIPFVLLLIWEFTGRSGMIKTTFLPRPSYLWNELLSLLVSGELLKNLLISIIRVTEGFLLGAILGVAIGIQVALIKNLRVAVSLIFGLLRPIPVIAWIPLLILWMGIDEGSKITVIAIGSFWTVFINVVEGIRQVDKKYLEVATILGKSKSTLIWKVILPSAMPSIFTGVRVGIDVAWRSVVAAELIAASSGIGYMIMYARELSQTDVVLIGILSIGVTGILIEQVLKRIEKRVLRWNVNIH